MRFSKWFIFITLTVQCTEAYAGGVEAKMPVTDNISEQWIVVSSESKIEILPATKEEKKDYVALYANSKIDDPMRLESAFLIKEDGSIVSTVMDRGEIAWQNSDERRDKIAELEEQILKIRERVTKLRTQYEEAQRTLRVRAGLTDIEQVYEKIKALDDEITRLK